jgi:circadian clock protein KaiC
MGQPPQDQTPYSNTLEHIPTGISGLDEILNGGIPKGRPTLVCGGPGCGKTMLAMEFLARGAEDYNEPGVFMSFEETAEELIKNFTSLDIDIYQLIANNKISIDYVHVERSEIEETGEYNLEGLFIRLGDAIDSIGAKRVVLDTIESLFSGFSNEPILRSELRRLFRWLKEKGVTAIITGERGQGLLTRHGLEEYISDCVILLDHRVKDQIAIRYLRVVKFRGSKHNNDEFPYLIGDHGIWLLPVTSLGLNYPVTDEYISSGIPRLDTMLDGKGFFRGSTILVSGTSGSGKSSLATHFIAAACNRREKCLYFAYEESASQIVRNMRSIGFDLQSLVDQGRLRFQAVRPSMYGIEMHLLIIQQAISEYEPSVVVVDPITSLFNTINLQENKSAITRLIDFLKMKQITTIFTSLTTGESVETSSEVGISSLVDSWLLARYLENNGERDRGLYILKSRGMNHSNQIREFRLTDHGVELLDVYLGTEGILVGAARITHEAQVRIETENNELEMARKKYELERKQQELASQITSLQASITSTQYELDHILHMEELRKQMAQNVETQIAHSRRADDPGSADNNSPAKIAG